MRGKVSIWTSAYGPLAVAHSPVVSWARLRAGIASKPTTSSARSTDRSSEAAGTATQMLTDDAGAAEKTLVEHPADRGHQQRKRDCAEQRQDERQFHGMGAFS